MLKANKDEMYIRCFQAHTDSVKGGMDMKNRSRLTTFLKRNGVYLALVVSLLAIGAVVIAGLTRQLAKPNDPNPQNAQQQVEQIVTGQKDTRTTKTDTSTTANADTTIATSTTDAPYLYLLPLTNTVQKPFSADGPLYCETMQDWRLHLGADFAGEEGDMVKAVTKGTITKIENDPLWGGVIEIDHGVGVVTRYCGVKATVRVGDTVEAGDGIGDLQTIPCECAQSAHLHLEMLVDGSPIDPVAAIARDVRYAETTE